MNERKNGLCKALEHIPINIYSVDINISNFYLKSWVPCVLLCFFAFFFQVPPQISLVTFWCCEPMLTSRKLCCKLLVSFESGSSFSYLIKLESCSDSQQWTALDCAKKVEKYILNWRFWGGERVRRIKDTLCSFRFEFY